MVAEQSAKDEQHSAAESVDTSEEDEKLIENEDEEEEEEEDPEQGGVLLLKEDSEEEAMPKPTQNLPSPVFAALLYGFCSGSMNFANKAVFIGFDFQATTLLLQMLFTIVVLRVLRSCGAVQFEDYDRTLGMKLALPSLMYCANIVCSLMSLGALSIPVYNVLKRMTPVACLILAYFILGKKPEKTVVVSIALIAVGTIVMGCGDIVFDISGYALGLGSILSQSLYLTYVQKQGIKMDMMTILYVNSINCLPILVAIMLSIGEYQRLMVYNGWGHPGMYTSLGLLLVVGGLLNYSLFLCTVVNSAVLTTVVGVIKAVFTTFIGFYTFGGQPLTPLLIAGVLLNTAGAVMYSVLTYLRKKKQKQEEEAKLQLSQRRDEMAQQRKTRSSTKKTKRRKKSRRQLAHGDQEPTADHTDN